MTKKVSGTDTETDRDINWGKTRPYDPKGHRETEIKLQTQIESQTRLEQGLIARKERQR